MDGRKKGQTDKRANRWTEQTDKKKTAKRSLVLDPDSIGGGPMGVGGWVDFRSGFGFCLLLVLLPVRE